MVAQIMEKQLPLSAEMLNALGFSGILGPSVRIMEELVWLHLGSCGLLLFWASFLSLGVFKKPYID